MLVVSNAVDLEGVSLEDVGLDDVGLDTALVHSVFIYRTMVVSFPGESFLPRGASVKVRCHRGEAEGAPRQQTEGGDHHRLARWNYQEGYIL